MYQSQSGASSLRITRGPIVSTVAVQFRGMDVVTQLFGAMDEASSALAGHVSLSATVAVEGANQEILCVLSHASLATEGTDRHFFTHSGLDFTRRTSKDGPLASNFYPMVLGARVDSSRGPQSGAFTVHSSHSMAAGSHRDGELELMVHRSLAQDDGRGLSEPVNDPSRLEVPLWIAFGPNSDFEFRVRSIRLNNPLRAFYKVPAPSSVAVSDAFMAHDHVNSPLDWSARQHVRITPLRAPLPPAVHLLSLFVRDSVSDDVVVRFQHLDPDPSSAWVATLGELFEETFAVAEVRRATLSLNTVIPLAAAVPKRVWNFAKTDDAVASPYDNMGARSGGGGGATDSQNTNEEGVFLSQSALEKLRQDQLARQQTARRLLQVQLQREADVMDVRAAIVAPHSVTPAATAAARRLHGDAAVPPAASSSSSSSIPSAPLFVLKSLQLHTYVFRLSGSEWAERSVGVMVGVGHREGSLPDNAQSKPKPATPLPLKPTQRPNPNGADQTRTSPIDTHAIDLGAPLPPVSNLQQPPAGGVDAAAGAGAVAAGGVASSPNVLDGHEHTVIPGRSGDAWRLIPSRWEYVLVLVASLVGVAFFLQALRAMARGGSPLFARQKRAIH